MTSIVITQEQRKPIPTADQQLEFLNHIQQLIRLAETTSTYKFALLLSITRLAIEQGKLRATLLHLKLPILLKNLLSSIGIKPALFILKKKILYTDSKCRLCTSKSHFAD